jgi:hypothetical protein
VSKNNITGDEIKSKVSSTYAENFDNIFRKENIEIIKDSLSAPITNSLLRDANQSKESCSYYPDLCFCETSCQKERQKAIAQNGNTGLHYELTKEDE